MKSAYINLACKLFFADFQRRNDLSIKSFTGQNSGLISYLKTVLESLISGPKSCFVFPVLPVFMVKVLAQLLRDCIVLLVLLL